MPLGFLRNKPAPKIEPVFAREEHRESRNIRRIFDALFERDLTPDFIPCTKPGCKRSKYRIGGKLQGKILKLQRAAEILIGIGFAELADTARRNQARIEFRLDDGSIRKIFHVRRHSVMSGNAEVRDIII